MSSFLDKLNLRPNERRLVVIVGVVVAAFLYYFLVWPQFGEWQKLRKKGQEAEMTLNRFEKQIARKAQDDKELATLQRKVGQRVETAAQDIDLQRNVYSIAAASGVNPGAYTASRPQSAGGKTNAWFEEQSGSIQFTAEESALVNFLNALSSGDSLIRVASMTLSPDQPRQRLLATITLVASYPRKAPSRPPGLAAPGPARPPVKPVALAGGPKSISAAVAGANQPAGKPVASSSSWWGKVKNFVGWGKSAKATAPAKGGTPTNTSIRLPPPLRTVPPTNASTRPLMPGRTIAPAPPPARPPAPAGRPPVSNPSANPD